MSLTNIEYNRVTSCYHKAMVLSRGNIPYIFGGGHNPSFIPDPGLDCSSAASLVLRAGGLLASPRAQFPFDTNAFEAWGIAGEGSLLTLWVLDIASLYIVQPALAAKLPTMETHHVFLQFKGHYQNMWFQAAHPGLNVGWITADPSGFRPRHWPHT